MASDTITLRSSDKQTFEVPHEVACMSETIAQMVGDTEGADMVPVPNVLGVTMSKVLEYCDKHVDSHKELTDLDDTARRKKEQDLAAWDMEFISVDEAVLYHLLLAANYLNIKSLLDLCATTVANIIKGKTPEEIRQYFQITNDFKPEEEEEVQRENQWAFE